MASAVQVQEQRFRHEEEVDSVARPICGTSARLELEARRLVARRRAELRGKQRVAFRAQRAKATLAAKVQELARKQEAEPEERSWWSVVLPLSPSRTNDSGLITGSAIAPLSPPAVDLEQVNSQEALASTVDALEFAEAARQAALNTGYDPDLEEPDTAACQANVSASILPEVRGAEEMDWEPTFALVITHYQQRDDADDNNNVDDPEPMEGVEYHGPAAEHADTSDMMDIDPVDPVDGDAMEDVIVECAMQRNPTAFDQSFLQCPAPVSGQGLSQTLVSTLGHSQSSPPFASPAAAAAREQRFLEPKSSGPERRVRQRVPRPSPSLDVEKFESLMNRGTTAAANPVRQPVAPGSNAPRNTGSSFTMVAAAAPALTTQPARIGAPAPPTMQEGGSWQPQADPVMLGGPYDGRHIPVPSKAAGKPSQKTPRQITSAQTSTPLSGLAAIKANAAKSAWKGF